MAPSWARQAFLSDLRPHPWVPWSGGQWGAPAVLATITLCAPAHPDPQEGPLPSALRVGLALQTCGHLESAVVMLVACPSGKTDRGPPGRRAGGGGAAGTSVSLQSSVPTESLAASVTPGHPLSGTSPGPRRTAGRGPAGSSLWARWPLSLGCSRGPPCLRPALPPPRLPSPPLSLSSGVVTSPVCSFLGLFLGCLSLLRPGPGVFLERGESDCSLSRAHLGLILPVSLGAFFLRWFPAGADMALQVLTYWLPSFSCISPLSSLHVCFAF